jgi:hypothetical protein
MTVSNIIELIVLILSIPVSFYMTKKSNRQLDDLDGLGDVVKKKDEKGIVVAQF